MPDQPNNLPVKQNFGHPKRRKRRRKNEPTDKMPSLRVSKYYNLPKDCPFSLAQVMAMNRHHDEVIGDLPSWLVAAPVWLDKNPDDEDKQAGELQLYHWRIDEQRNRQLLQKEAEFQTKLIALAPKPKPENDQKKLADSKPIPKLPPPTND